MSLRTKENSHKDTYAYLNQITSSMLRPYLKEVMERASRTPYTQAAKPAFAKKQV